MAEGESKKKVDVFIHNEKDTRKTEFYDKMLNDIQKELYDRYEDDTIFEYEDINKLIEDYRLPSSSGNVDPSKQTGVVSLKPSGGLKDSLRNKEFADSKEAMKELVSRAQSGDSEALEILDIFWHKKTKTLSGFEGTFVRPDPIATELGKENYDWHEFTNFVQRKSKEQSAKGGAQNG